ncbi:MAG TPA: hypothetical protein VEL07_07065 [Planctomycetota bacterium]|nr:hypothetical protein [Planctomycetota bacterium]
MRIAPVVICLVLAVIALTGCGGSSRATEEGFGLENAPSASQADGLTAQVLHYKQRENYLIVNLRLSNTGKDTIVLKNPGSTLIGFSASAEGRTVSAEKRASGSYWSPWTGVVVRDGGGNSQDNLELPAGITTEMELRWNWKPELPREDYAWRITIGQAYKGETRLEDLTIAYPPTPSTTSAVPAAAK